METFDLNSFDLAELKELKESVDAEIDQRKSEKRLTAMAQIKTLAKDAGINLPWELKSPESKPDRKPVAPKYRHPGDPNLTWSGRGRTPKWLSAQIEAGYALESFLI